MLRIKQELQDRQITQAYVARRAGVGEASVSRIVRGLEPAYPARGKRIADAIGYVGDWRELFEEVK